MVLASPDCLSQWTSSSLLIMLCYQGKYLLKSRDQQLANWTPTTTTSQKLDWSSSWCWSWSRSSYLMPFCFTCLQVPIEGSLPHRGEAAARVRRKIIPFPFLNGKGGRNFVSVVPVAKKRELGPIFFSQNNRVIYKLSVEKQETGQKNKGV